GIAVVYAVWLLYAGGLKYLLLSALLYAPGAILFAKAKHEVGQEQHLGVRVHAVRVARGEEHHHQEHLYADVGQPQGVGRHLV
ncbi:hypothetical protein IGA75_31815, partial [Pseudomonas aeruginosa]